MQKEKLTIMTGPVRKIFFSLPVLKDNEIKGEITQSRHHANVLHGLMDASIIEIIERVMSECNFFSEEHIKRMIDEWRTGCH